MNNTVTPGWKTSEFWIHLLAYAPVVAAVFLPASSPILLGIAAVTHLGSAFYTAQRSGVKIAAMAQQAAPSAASIAEAAASALDAAAKALPPAPTVTPMAPALAAALTPAPTPAPAAAPQARIIPGIHPGT